MVAGKKPDISTDNFDKEPKIDYKEPRIDYNKRHRQNVPNYSKRILKKSNVEERNSEMENLRSMFKLSNKASKSDAAQLFSDKNTLDKSSKQIQDKNQTHD